MNESFYLTLPSNASSKVYPNNTVAHYFTVLPTRLNLSGEWEAGLCEIHFPRTWYNIGRLDGVLTVYTDIHSSEEKGARVSIAAGNYSDPRMIVSAIEEVIRKSEKQHLSLNYDTFLQRISITLKPKTRLAMSDTLRDIFGFMHSVLENIETTEKTYTAPLAADTDRGIKGLYVYTDVIQPRVVGDTRVRLLRVVPIQGAQGQMVAVNFQNIHYVNVLYKEFDTIEIYITDDTGEIVPFESGKLVVTLHFRPKHSL